jgi:C-terminal processing protease CtpA/Prc
VLIDSLKEHYSFAELKHVDWDEFSRPFRDQAISAPYVKPVVCLVGPGCVSSGEGFALMMKALDHVRLVGQPTRGASGNPHPVTLPNGVKVWYSRWVSMEADGTPIEGRGVQPDITVRHAGPRDATFERGVAILRELSHSPSVDSD